MKVKTLLIIGITVVTLTASGLIIASALKSGNNDSGDNGGNSEPNKGGSSKNSGGSSSGGSSYVSESFPLKKGMKGDNVKKLQNALGVTADGMFGNNTENALYAKYKVTSCNQTLFDSIMLSYSKTNGGYSTNTSNAEPSQKMKGYAEKLYDALEGLGTNKTKIKEVFSEIETIEELNSLIDAFAWYATKHNPLHGFKSSDNKLGEWLYDDMDKADMELYVYKPLKANGITYQF